MEQGAEDVPVVYLHEIKRQYTQGDATLTILDGAKLALWAGQSVALVAPSGAGKSTLLHIAGCSKAPTTARSMSAARRPRRLSDIERTQIRRTDIGFVYQSHRLLPEFSALENVMLPQMIRGLKRGETVKRATEILAYLGPGRSHQAPAGRTVRRRAAAGGDRARGRQCAAGAVCGRADRQSRSAAPPIMCSGADAAGEGDSGRDADRDPQHGAGRPHGPAGVAGERRRSSSWTSSICEQDFQSCYQRSFLRLQFCWCFGPRFMRGGTRQRNVASGAISAPGCLADDRNINSWCGDTQSGRGFRERCVARRRSGYGLWRQTRCNGSRRSRKRGCWMIAALWRKRQVRKIIPFGVNPFRRGSYPSNTASVPRSNREQRSRCGQQQVGPRVTGSRAVWSDAPLPRWQTLRGRSKGLKPKQSALYLLQANQCWAR